MWLSEWSHMFELRRSLKSDVLDIGITSTRQHPKGRSTYGCIGAAVQALFLSSRGACCRILTA